MKLIFTNSVAQSESAMWFKERLIRVTASIRPHSIKIRQKNFESLARQFHNNRYKTVMTQSMACGINTEPEAKSKLSKIMGKKIYKSRLIVWVKQPFLACSPDGLVFNEENFELIEIKCPSSCAHSEIFNDELGQTHVEYLIPNSNKKPELKKKHRYYTQIQSSLYVTGLKLCHLFVYSHKQWILLQVVRDNEFLKDLIPRVENFYFTYFLQGML